MAHNLCSKSLANFLRRQSSTTLPQLCIIPIIKRNLNFAAEVKDFQVKNEPFLGYLANSDERRQLQSAIDKYRGNCVDVPIIIGGKEIRTDNVQYQVSPFDHGSKIAKFYWATPEVVQQAIDSNLEARKEWERVPLQDKINLFLKAADLVSGKYRMEMLATTMIGQAKTIFQAEIDAAAELADFLRFNAYYACQLTRYQPISDVATNSVNQYRQRGIEGFVAAISPFNFTAIGGNLATSPALMGNVVIWKPSDTAMLSNYLVMKILMEAGFPPGVINFVPCDGPIFGDTITASPHLAGINFTGSVPTFRRLWQQTAANLNIYRNFPRLVGECGGKNYHFVHESANIESVANHTIRSAFEFGGQKCSACSRLYVPDNRWPELKAALLATRDQLKLGSPLEFDTFLSAVIDSKAFQRITGYIEHAKNTPGLKVLGGGKSDNSKGYYVEPTIVETENPKDKMMTEEIFGPVLTAYVYKAKDVEETMNLIDTSTPYALTGAIFAEDKHFLEQASERLKQASGMLYLNDKSTGAVVGQQPFGGGRLSGTNDKAGGPHYLLRWSSPQTIKQTGTPLTDWRYPYMSS